MRRVGTHRLFGVAALLLAPSLAEAAWTTKTLTAAEKDNVFDLELGVGFDRSSKTAKITREWVQQQNGVLTALDVKEMLFEELSSRLNFDLRVGIFHDLELHVRAPLILGTHSNIRFAEGVEGRSTVCCAGDPNADDPQNARYPITEVPADRYRGGFGDMSFGLAWSPFVDVKDEAYPTLTLRADVIAPTGGINDPTDPKSLIESEGGAVGMGLTVFDLSLGVSRRMQAEAPAFDPYMVFGALLPIANSSQKDKFGMEPAFTGRFTVGTELILFEESSYHQKYAFDFSFTTRYVGTARSYSELSDYLPNFNPTKVLANRTAIGVRPDEFVYSDLANPANYASQAAGARCGSLAGVPCGEMTKVDEYLQLRGDAALLLKFSEYAYVRAGIGIEHNTDHFLTNERVGKDLDPPSASNADCDGAECVGRVNARNSFFDRAANACPAGRTCDERSPYYDPRYDALGRRLRIEETVSWTVFVSGAATF